METVTHGSPISDHAEKLAEALAQGHRAWVSGPAGSGRNTLGAALARLLPGAALLEPPPLDQADSGAALLLLLRAALAPEGDADLALMDDAGSPSAAIKARIAAARRRTSSASLVSRVMLTRTTIWRTTSSGRRASLCGCAPSTRWRSNGTLATRGGTAGASCS